MTVDELADAVAEGDREQPRGDGPDGPRSEIRTALHHVHLPVLEEAGLITYDEEAHRAEPTARLDRGASQLSAVGRPGTPLEAALD